MCCRSERFWRGVWVGLGLLAMLAAGCGDDERPVSSRPPAPAPRPGKDEGKKVLVGQNVFLEVLPSGRRVLVSAEVCLREGLLEQLLTRKGTKEHEAILAANVDARKVHEALILAGAKEGSPVRFVPKFRLPSGSTIQVSLIYEQKGNRVTVPARSWIRNMKTRTELESDWVFAGSHLVDNPLDPKGPKQYLANEGDLICVCNFEAALLDVPFESSKSDGDRGYEAWTERIPPVGTKVVVVLEPMPAAKKR